MFRRLTVVSVVAVMCFVMVGCFSVKVCAPMSGDISLAPDVTPMAFKTEVRSWYLLWGLVPLSNAEDGVSQTIKSYNLTSVRVETTTTPIDWLISVVLGSISVGTRTTIVEGNAN
jgi:hypothetical protein